MHIVEVVEVLKRPFIQEATCSALHTCIHALPPAHKSAVSFVIATVMDLLPHVALMCLLASASCLSLEGHTRSLHQLAGVMQCATQLTDIWSVLSTYNCYGCWCGKGGGGAEPVDEIDEYVLECCQSGLV